MPSVEPEETPLAPARGSGLASSEDPGAPLDRHGRPLKSLRLSVTDRCNLRCGYCMPEESYTWLERDDILRFEESAALVEAFCDAGVRKVRLTGGEPLLRRDVDRLVALLAGNPLVEDLALTSNAILLSELAKTLKQAGLTRLTLSLDTLRPERFRELTRRDEIERVHAGIAAAHDAGFQGTKMNTVVMKGINDDELFDLVDYARERGIEPRFIEYMDVGGATNWRAELVVSRDEMLRRFRERYRSVDPLPRADRAAPADRFRLPDGTTIGIIASQTAPFCAACDRSRLTADGMWYHCLYARIGTDLRSWIRSGVPREELAARIRGCWVGRAERGAEERAELPRRASWSAQELRSDPHLEMHTRGG